RDYRITDVFNKKEYFQLELKTDATSFINSRFLNNEDLLRKYLSDYYTPIEISKLKDVKIYVYVKSLDTVHDVFSWGFTRSYAPKSPIEVLKNLKKIENEIKAGTFRFIKVNYTYRKSEKQIVQKITMSLLEACKNNFFVKLSVYNSLKNNCNIDLCKMDYSSFDIFKYIYDVSGCYNIDPLLIISLIARESDGINNFKETGAVGLGQFTTKTGEGNDLLIFNNSETYHDFRHHPLLNIGASISYLKERLDVAMKDLSKRGIEDALWYYNFGQKPIINYFSNIKSSKISEKINLILENAPANDTMNKKLEISQYAPTILSYYLFYNFLGISKKDSSSFSKDINSLLSTYNSALYFPQGEIK
ncbi:MAG: transglycosylase SLT domain-containing protein, partial [Candidatus Woesearchaeota archaeon]